MKKFSTRKISAAVNFAPLKFPADQKFSPRSKNPEPPSCRRPLVKKISAAESFRQQKDFHPAGFLAAKKFLPPLGIFTPANFHPQVFKLIRVVGEKGVLPHFATATYKPWY